MNPIADIWI